VCRDVLLSCVLFLCSDVYSLDGVLVACVLVANVCGLPSDQLMQQDIHMHYYEKVTTFTKSS
jgi:hypothetical protein